MLGLHTLQGQAAIAVKMFARIALAACIPRPSMRRCMANRVAFRAAPLVLWWIAVIMCVASSAQADEGAAHIDALIEQLLSTDHRYVDLPFARGDAGLAKRVTAARELGALGPRAAKAVPALTS